VKQPEPSIRRILVTSALPYANGHIHLGHLVEYIQTDIFVRFQNLRGHRAIYLCADDTHGTAIMIRAKSEGRGEQELIAAMRLSHLADFGDFQIGFDHYGSTDSAANRTLCASVWQALRRRDLVTARAQEANEDVGLNVLDHVAEVDRTIGVRQSTRDEGLLRVHFNAPARGE